MSFEIIYEQDDSGEIYWRWRNDAESMKKAGLTVRTEPSPNATVLLYRGSILDEKDFPKDYRYLQTPKTYGKYLHMERWYPLIEDLTIPTFFVDQLGKEATRLIKAKEWERAFVKNSVKSLVEENPLESVWPDVSFEAMNMGFSQNPREGRYCLRKYVEPKMFEQERRYWVIGKDIHHSSGIIPEIVRGAARRLSVFEGVFYTIDATPELIVEVGPGECCDRKTDNKAEDFARWIKNAF